MMTTCVDNEVLVEEFATVNFSAIIQTKYFG